MTGRYTEYSSDSFHVRQQSSYLFPRFALFGKYVLSLLRYCLTNERAHQGNRSILETIENRQIENSMMHQLSKMFVTGKEDVFETVGFVENALKIVEDCQMSQRKIVFLGLL